MLAFTSSSLGAPCLSASAAAWQFAGPSAYYQRGDPLKLLSASAVQKAVRSSVPGKETVRVSRCSQSFCSSLSFPSHCTFSSAQAWFAGSVNGGVWKTRSANATIPQWHNVLDGQPVTCSSIGALHVAPADESIVFAGCGGSTSSMNGAGYNVMNSGDWNGVMASTDQGVTWAMTRFPKDYYVTDLLTSTKDASMLLVAAQSNLHKAGDGGIWRASVENLDATSAKVSNLATFTLTTVGDATIATHARLKSASVSISHDDGATWASFDSDQLHWDGMVPFYTCAAAVRTGTADAPLTLVVGGLTVDASDATKTSSNIYYRSMAPGAKWAELKQPTPMDEDAMPKDRMALFGDPDAPHVLYVAGNAGALAWRVDLSTGVWVKLWDDDVVDGSEPHGDCRNFAWNPENDELVLTSDGGVFSRIAPRAPGGRWRSLNGDIKAMEYLSAQYDNRLDRYVAGAQDNSAQVFASHATADSAAIGFVGGDGTVTLVDNVHSPSRLFGTTQFLGVGTIDIDPSDAAAADATSAHGELSFMYRYISRESCSQCDSLPLTSLTISGARAEMSAERDADDEDCGGLCFVQGGDYIGVPLADYFPQPSSFPYFVQPYALHSQVSFYVPLHLTRIMLTI